MESRNVISSATIYTILEIRLSGLPLTFHSNQSCLAIFLAAAIFFGQYMVPKNQRDQMLLFCLVKGVLYGLFGHVVYIVSDLCSDLHSVYASTYVKRL